MASPKPYKIEVPQSKIDTLKSKLSQAEFPDELEDAQWDMGAPLADIKRLAKAWEQWDWRQAESKLNELPHFTTDITVDGFDPLNIHFIHQKSSVKGAIPLLFVHGWPGSFLEVTKLLKPFSTSTTPAFHIVAPSLPNYGFSQGVSKRGFAIAQYAEACHKLMLQLGYDQYVTQGGDWGWFITRCISKFYPDSCKATHFNLFMATPPSLKTPIRLLQHYLVPWTEDEKKGLERSKWFQKEGCGYFMEQSTKPQTLAYALTDSPVALLSWIYEKLHDWTDSYPWTDDEIFTWVSIYAFSRASPGAAHRIYYEVSHTSPAGAPGSKNPGFMRQDAEAYIPMKIGLCRNPKEIAVLPKNWCRGLGEVVYESDNEAGGHFCAWERPEYIVRDLKAMLGKGGPAFGVVKGASGYEDDRARL